VDLFAIISDQPHIIQVKHTASGVLKKGPEVVRALLGSAVLKNAEYASLVTSASEFTPSTLELANRINKLENSKVKMKLANLNNLLDMIEKNIKKDNFIERLLSDNLNNEYYLK